jgi:hypothetical protein
MGVWLNAGFGLLRWAGRLLVVAVLVVLPLASFHWLPLWVTRSSQGTLTTVVTLLVIPGVGLLAFRKRLSSFALGFRAPLDIVLDVDNYLREHPRRTTPKARIFARYAALLRYVDRWRDGSDQPYDAIVIVAHSQGAAITADLLRLLKHLEATTEPCVCSRPIFLFTMGNPLRQLYGLRFPDLYSWARHAEGSAWNERPPRPIPDNQKPDPDELLGVRRWINAYRSGDYVGRWLWRADTCAYQFDAQQSAKDGWTVRTRVDAPFTSEDRMGKRREFCIGAGAHTHYWDETAPAIAVELDFIIREAASLAEPTAGSRKS